MPLVEDLLPAATYDAVDEYVDNVLYVKNSKQKDNVLITLIRLADALGNGGVFDEDAAVQDWKDRLQITSDKAVEGEFTVKNPKADVVSAIETIYGTVNNVISQIVFKDNDHINDLSDFAVAEFLNNSLISTIAKGVFSLADNETVAKIFNILNVKMTKDYIVKQLNYYGYAELATNISSYTGKLADIPWFTTQKDADGNDIQVPSDEFGKLWYVSSKYDTTSDYTDLFITNVWNTSGAYQNPDYAGLTGEALKKALDVTYRFSRALVIVLSPFSALIEVLTTNHEVDFGNNVSIKGSYGYTSAIKPFLDAFGVNSVHRDKYRADAEKNPDYAIYNIVYPLIERIDTIMQRPVRGLLDTLPTLANFINAGGIQTAIQNLLFPIDSLLQIIVDLLMDDFDTEVSSDGKTIYQIALEVADTAFLDGAITQKAKLSWDTLHTDISGLVDVLFPTLYTTTYKDSVYTAKLSQDENGKDVYTISVKRVDANNKPVLDKDGKEIYDDVVIPKTDITSTENGILINGVAYPIIIPEDINGLLAKLAGCQGETAVQTTTGSFAPVVNTADDTRANVLVTLLRFVWDDVVRANFNDFLDPLLTNVVDPLLEGTLENAYSEVIRPYIVKESILPWNKDNINYDGGEFIDLIIGAIKSLDASGHHAGASWKPYVEAARDTGFTVEYPRVDTTKTGGDRYQSQDVKTLVSVITNIAMSAIEAFLDMSIVGLQEGNIYDSSFVVTVAKAIYPLLDSAAVATVFEVLGMKAITLESLADALRTAGYPRTADLVLAGYDENVVVDGVKVNYVERVKKELNNETGKLEDVLDKDKNPVMESVYKYWATEEDGYTWKYLPDGTTHVMTFWIPDETEADGYAYEKYTAEDEKADPSHKEGEYKLDSTGNKIRAIREKQFSDINWTPCIEGKFFNIQTVAGQTEDQWRANLVKALSTILHPLTEVLNFLLNSGELNIYGLANLTGADGYENAIYPLLQVLGCTKERNGLKTPAEYKAEAVTDSNNLIYNILNPVFSRLNNILRGSTATGEAIGPVRAVLNLLPGLALFVEQGGVQKLVEELIYPIGNIADTIIGVLSKDNSKLFDVVFDALLAADTLEPLHTKDGFEGTGITDRIIEKIIVAVFNAPEKTKEDGTMDDAVIQWGNVQKHVYELVAGFVKANEDASNVYLTATEDGKLEINNIKLTLAEKKDENGNVTRPESKVTLPAIQISSLNDLLSDLSKLGAPIPWGTPPNNDGMNATAVQRRTDAFVILWNFIWGIVENNRDANGAIPTLINDFVKPLLGDETFKLMGKYINKILLDRTAEDVLSAFIAVTKALDSSSFDVQSTWDDYFAKAVDLAPVQYPVKNYATDTTAEELYTSKDVGSVVHTISGIAQSVLSAVTGNTIADLSVDLLYNDKLIATISQAIFNLADNNVVKAFLPLLGVNGLSIDGIAAKLTEYGYAELAAEVNALKGGVGKDDGKLSDLVWFVPATNDKDEEIKDDDGNTVMVPSELAKKWYISDGDGFIDNVWKTTGAYQNPNISEADIDANYRFTRAIVVALSPFSGLINTLFNARTSTVFGEIQLTGAKGYRNAVKPLLQALGADAMSVNDFNAYIDGNNATLDDGTVIANGNQDYVIYNILNPILSKVDDIIHNPGDQLFATIASLGAFLSDSAFKAANGEDKGNLQSAVENLLKPVLDLIDPIVKLADDDEDLFTIIFNILGIYHHDKDGKNETLVTWNNIHQHLFDVVAHFLGFDDKNPDNLYMTTLDKQLIVNNITINGKKYSLTVPEYNLSKLKNCTVDSEIAKRASDAFVTVFRYIRSILNANSIQKHSDGSYVGDGDTYKLDDNAFIPSLVNDLLNNADLYATLKPYLQNVLGSQEDEILITVIRLFENLDKSDLLSDVDEIAKDWADQLKLSGTTADVNYGGVTLNEVSNAIDTLRTSVHNALNAYTDIKLENFTAEYIYQNSIINTLASVIFPLGDNATVAALLKILHIDVTRDGIVKELEKYGYTELADKFKALMPKKILVIFLGPFRILKRTRTALLRLMQTASLYLRLMKTASLLWLLIRNSQISGIFIAMTSSRQMFGITHHSTMI